MLTRSPLSFKVTCADCYGTEIWKLERIIRVLSETSVTRMPEPLTDSDVEHIAKLFSVHIKQILCPGCGKTGTLTASRIFPTEH